MYQAIAYHQSLPEGRRAGILRSGKEGFTFTAEDCEQLIPLRGIHLDHGGTAGRLIYLKHDALPGWSFSTSNGDILKDPILDRLAGAERQKGRIQGARRFALISALILLALVAAVPVSLWVFRDQIFAAAVAKVPMSTDIKIGEVLEDGLKAEGNLIGNNALRHDLETMLKPLLEKAGCKDFTYRVHIIRDDSMNAFAAPGGLIVFHSGILLKAEHPDELIGVMAHELAHCNHRHGVQGLLKSVGSTLLVSALFGDVQGMSAIAIGGSQKLWSLSNSRDMETDADNTGWQYLVDAGLNPQGMIAMFEKLQKGHDGMAPPEILSTHPDTGARIEFLKTKWQQTGGKEKLKASAFDLKGFQARLKTYLDTHPEEK
jgi:beta-barrel assembly-enhancing protease